MKLPVWAPALVCLGGLWMAMAPSAFAQAARPADFIVAVVNAEPITNSEVSAEVQRILREMPVQQRQSLPPEAALRGQVLERLINEKAQLQVAQENGLRIEDSALEQAEQTVARQNQVEVAELYRRLAKDGIDKLRFRNQLRDQMLLSRLHEREVEPRARVSDTDVERYMAERAAENADPFAQEINLAQLLVAVPENSSAEQTMAISARVRQVLERIRAGASFEKLVQDMSDADRANGGALGLRRADRYPPSFVLATQTLGVGEVSEIVRSGAGFHILKVVEKRSPASFTQSVPQIHARHILLRVTPQLSQAQALDRLADYKRRIESGAASFEALARQYSEDGSAPQGGDLGWAGPGMFVPEFEEAMSRLADGQIGAPLVSRFGVHLIQTLERRRVDLSPRELREWVRGQLRESRYEEAFVAWAREVRGRAFVELREPPQ
ncbi:MAG: peptidylprolyl isomerase [Rhodoferax sp.]